MKKELPFDEKYFQKLKENGIELNMEEVFKKIHQENHWGDSESVSGQGSNSKQTATISVEIPKLLIELGVETLLDAPCGDLGWISKIDLPVKGYIGADIVPEVIAKNKRWVAENFSDTIKQVHYEFLVLDITKDSLPKAEIMLCRDCLVHLSFADIFRFLDNLKKSNIKYLLTTSFPRRTENQDIVTGDWRPLNLALAPFHFPKPLKVINENCTEGSGNYTDKSLILWEVDSIMNDKL